MRRTGALLLTTLLCLAGCGAKQRQGLVIARSVFKEGPSPATMLVLHHGKDGWSRAEAAVPADKIELQTGIGGDGTPYVRKIGPMGEPQSGPLTFAYDATKWTVAEAAGVTEESIAWKERDGKPERKAFELAGGNVFHKCMWFSPEHGEPGILTISANMPYLQIWREGPAGKFTAETLWTATVGFREHRFRDVEVGDVDGDGHDELVVVTHDAGAVYVLEQTDKGLEATEVQREGVETFVHEVEIGDVDGDGKLEFFTTPSEPNRLDGTEQEGRIDMYRWEAVSKSYQRTEVARMTDRHAKELLVFDDGKGFRVLCAALEAEGLKGEDARVIIRTWQWKDGAAVQAGDIPLEGEMCRFLNQGDTDGDGVHEIIASTRKQGIFAASRDGDGWKSSCIVPGYVSGGFEHATVVFDWDGDGRDELFVGSDTQKKLRRFWYDPAKKSYESEDILDFEGEKYFVWNIMPIPAPAGR